MSRQPLEQGCGSSAGSGAGTVGQQRSGQPSSPSTFQLMPHQRSSYLPNRAVAYNTSCCRTDEAHGLFCARRRREQRQKDMMVATNRWCGS